MTQILLDADTSVFFARQLEIVKTNTYDIEYPEITYNKNFPVAVQGGLGIKTITYRQFDRVGVSKIIASYADDAPRIDVFGNEFTTPVRMLGDSFGYSIQDIQAAAYAGLPLESRLAIAAREAIERQQNSIAYFGDSEYNLNGFLSDPSVPINDSSAVFSTLNADQLIAEITDAVASVMVATRGIEVPDTILLPVKQYNQISTTPRSSVSDTTVLEFLLKAMPYIKRIDWAQELAGAGVDGVDVMLIYKNDPLKLEYQITAPFQMLPPQPKNFAFDIPCYSTSGGMIIYKPLSCAVLSHI